MRERRGHKALAQVRTTSAHERAMATIEQMVFAQWMLTCSFPSKFQETENNDITRVLRSGFIDDSELF